MPGGLLNIIAYGNQNIILNGNPSKTFFKVVYAKYTNFGIQKFRLDYNGTRDLDPNNDAIYTFKVPRNAELLLGTYLVFNLPDIWSTVLPPLYQGDIWKPYQLKWIHNIGTSIIKNIRIIIGNQTIQEYTGEYIRCVVERDFNESKKKMFNVMSGNIDELHSPENYGGTRNNNYPNSFFTTELDGQEPSIRGRKIYVPLNPWFMNNSKLALPLVSLQYSELTIEITLRPIREIFTINNIKELRTISEEAVSDTAVAALDLYNKKLDDLYTRIQPSFTNEYHSMYRFLQPPPTIELTESDYKDKRTNWNADLHIIADYCFLSPEESKIFALNEQKYLIQDVHETIYHNIVGTKKVKVDSNALVSSWLWFYRRNDAYIRNEWSNYTNWKYTNLPYVLENGEKIVPYLYSGDINVQQHNGPYYDAITSADGEEGNTISTLIPTNHRFTPTFSIQNNKYILERFAILIDGKYRENEMDAGIYSYIEKYRASPGNSDIGMYNYNFCINTHDKNQPSGAINLSRFKNIELEMVTIMPEINPDSITLTLCDENNGVIGVTKPVDQYIYTYDMHLFEERYNILRFISGSAGLLYAR